MKAAGRAPATCWQIVDCGLQRWEYDHSARMVRELAFSFELWDAGTCGGRRCIEQRYNWSFWPTSKLRQHLAGWFGRDVSIEERRAFDFQSLIGRSVTLQLERVGGYDRLRGMSPAPYDQPSHRAPIFLMLQDYNPAMWPRLTQRLRDRIMDSPTFEAMYQPTDEFPPDYVRPASADFLEGDEIPW